MTRHLKIIVEKRPDGYAAYPLGLSGMMVGERDSYEEALENLKSAIAFRLETFGDEALEVDTALEAFIAEAGGHPFLLQAASLALWEAYDAGEGNAQARYREAGDYLFHQAQPVLKDAWRLWTPEMQKAFTVVALDNMPLLLGQRREYDLNALLRSLPDDAPELRALESRGYICPEAQLPGGWRLQAEVMSWRLAEELRQALRQGDELGAWLQTQGWEGILKRGKKESLSRAGKKISDFLKGGVEVFIRTAAEGLGKGMTGA